MTGEEVVRSVYAAITAGDTDALIVCDTRQSGRGRGSGAEVAQEITHVWSVEDGVVTAMRAFADRESALAFANASDGGRHAAP